MRKGSGFHCQGAPFDINALRCDVSGINSYLGRVAGSGNCERG
jgi:hypothetical protein